MTVLREFNDATGEWDAMFEGPQGPPGADGADGADGAGFVWRGGWIAGIAYAVNDVVENGSTFICISAHTSSNDDEPGVGVNEATYWELYAQGGGELNTVDVVSGQSALQIWRGTAAQLPAEPRDANTLYFVTG